MIKAPRYPDLIDRSNTPLAQAASRFTGVLNVAYHNPTSYAQKYMKRNAPPKSGRHDPLLTMAGHSGMPLRKLHKETVRRQRFLEEKKRQAEMEEAKQRERVLEERHLRRLEQAKLIRYRIRDINQNQKITTHSQRTFSERAFPARAVKSQVSQPRFGTKSAKTIATDKNQMPFRYNFYEQRQPWPATEGSEVYSVERKPLRSINNLNQDITVQSKQFNASAMMRNPEGSELNSKRSANDRYSEECTVRGNSGIIIDSETKLVGSHLTRELEVSDRPMNGGNRLEVSSNVSSSVISNALTAPTIIDPGKRYGQLQPLSQENLDALNRKEYDQKSIQSEPPLHSKSLKIMQNREEDELMRNLANLNEKLAALRLKKSIDVNRFDSTDANATFVEPVTMPQTPGLQKTSNQSALPEIRRRWLVPKLVRTPTAYSRRNRAR